jgi:hypothetical protein
MRTRVSVFIQGRAKNTEGKEMTELELFGYAVVAATSICVGVWLMVATYLLLWVWEWARDKE